MHESKEDEYESQIRSAQKANVNLLIMSNQVSKAWRQVVAEVKMAWKTKQRMSYSELTLRNDAE